jgi:hypothetical protein
MNKETPQFVLLLLLLLFYCAGPTVILIMSILSIKASPGGIIENRWLINILDEVATKPTAYLNTIQQMIMPVAAAITAANSKKLIFSGIVPWLFAIPLVTIFVCIVDALILSSDVAPTFTNAGAAAQLCLSMANNLAVYVMLFVGLKLGRPENESEGS